MSDNLLSTIPGALIGAAIATLQPAEVSAEDTMDVTLELPDGTRARITFTRFYHKHGKSSRWFWTPEKAVKVDE